MNLQPTKQKIVGQKEFLRNAVGTEYKTGGATLDATAFGEGYVDAGTAVYLGENGLYQPWGDETEATVKGAGLTSHDVKVIGGQNPIVGVLAVGHPIESKCTGVNDAFKEAAKGRIVFDI
ncbi:hypothetical protein ACFSMW_13490 [Virgibacillus halophilus]